MQDYALIIGAGIILVIQVWSLILMMIRNERSEKIHIEHQESLREIKKEAQLAYQKLEESLFEKIQEIQFQQIKTHEVLIKNFEKEASPKPNSPINTTVMSEVMERVQSGQNAVDIAKETGVPPGEIELIRGLSNLIDKT